MNTPQLYEDKITYDTTQYFIYLTQNIFIHFYDVTMVNNPRQGTYEIMAIIPWHGYLNPLQLVNRWEFVYLGTPLTSNLFKQKEMENILLKFENKLSFWTFESLTIAGHFIFLKDVLQSLPTYLLSVMETPKAIIKKIRNIQCNFLQWGAPKEIKKFLQLHGTKSFIEKGKDHLVSVIQIY